MGNRQDTGAAAAKRKPWSEGASGQAGKTAYQVQVLGAIYAANDKALAQSLRWIEAALVRTALKNVRIKATALDGGGGEGGGGG